MNTFYIYKPKAKIAHKNITIVDLIPFGRDCAVKRQVLVSLCKQHNLINSSSEASEDRAMRILLVRARLDYVILNISDGVGYYRPSKDDLSDLNKFIRQEKNRAISSSKNHKRAEKLYEDYIHGRIDKE